MVMGFNVTQKLIAAHLVEGEMVPGVEIGLRIDQTLTQDAIGTMVVLELEALGLERVRTGVSVQYVDHNLLQTDERNLADHLFLRSACRRFGLSYSKPGNGVSHPTHMQRFGVPGASVVGSDSHTCAAGSWASSPATSSPSTTSTMPSPLAPRSPSTTRPGTPNIRPGTGCPPARSR
jgi:aconitate hydratase